MNILYCGDKNIRDGLIISILSLLENTNDKLNIYILTASVEHNGKTCVPLGERDVEPLDDLVRKYDPENFVKLYDVSRFVEKCPPTANMETRFTPGCMFRLYADLVDRLPSRILYLDNDVVCRKDISEFYGQDIDGYEVLGVLDYYGRWFFRRNPFKMDYVNSGVLLMNLREIRESGLFEKCRQRCQKKRMFMPDQSAINKLAERKKLCPRRYNEQRLLQEDTAMQHFTTSFRFWPRFRKVSVKPWHVEKMHTELGIYEYDELIKKYLDIKADLEENKNDK